MTSFKLAGFALVALLFAPAARAQHVEGWYAGAAAGLVGTATTAAGACNLGQPHFLAEQIASGVHENSWITTLISVNGSVCNWNGSVPGVFGPYGEVALLPSSYFPPPSFSSPLNNGGCDPRKENCQCPLSNPINPITGNKYQAETDYAGQGPHALRFERFYNSSSNLGPTSGFGTGWTHTYSRHVVRDGANVVAVQEDGRTLRFTLAGGAYVADSTSKEKLDRVTTPTLGWKLTNADDDVEMYDDSGRLLSITNRAGLAQTLTYGSNGKVATVTDPYGRTLTFTWGSGSRIASIDAPFGTVSYGYSADVHGKLVTVTYPGPATRTYHYENATLFTKLTGITDENGDRFSTYAYDSSGKANSTEHAGGANKVTLVHDSSTGTRSVSVTTHVSATQSAQHTYTFESIAALGRRTGVTASPGEPYPACGPKSQTNDGNGNATSKIDWNGNRTNYTFDPARNLEISRTEGLTAANSTTAQTRTITTEWHPVFRLRTGIAEPLRITTVTYDADGTTCGARGAMCSKSIQATSDGNGSLGLGAAAVGSPRTWTYAYNANGSVLTVNGPRTDVTDLTTYTYYANNASCPDTNDGHATGCRGQIETVANALSQVTSILAYDPLGQPKHIVDPNGLVTEITYRARGNLLSRSVGVETTTYLYDLAEQLEKVTLPDESFLEYTYDHAHRLEVIRDSLNNKITFDLDSMGNRIEEQVFRSGESLPAQKRSRRFSNVNRLFEEWGAQPTQKTEYTYDDQGNLRTVKNPLGHITTNDYDELNRLKQVTSPLPISAVTQYGYNGLDALIQVIDPRGFPTGYAVDGLGNLNQQTSPDTGTTTNTYDAAGNLRTQIDAKSQTTTYDYDALNRVALITFHDKSKQTYTYDEGPNGIGRLTGIVERNPAGEATSRIAYGYDKHGRIVSDTRTVNGVHVAAYRYDSAGRLDQITYPSGRIVTYTLDGLGRIAQLSSLYAGQSQTLVSNVAYHPFGGVKGFSFGNPPQAYARTYDQDGRIATYTLAGTGYTVGYDAASRIESITQGGNPPNTYGYDNLDRLETALLPGGMQYTYSYDAVGNRVSRTGSSIEVYGYGTTNGLPPKLRTLSIGTMMTSEVFNGEASTQS